MVLVPLQMERASVLNIRRGAFNLALHVSRLNAVAPYKRETVMV